MAQIETKIYELLKNDVTISQIVGTKIHYILADETIEEPYIVLDVISKQRDYTFIDTSTLGKLRLQVNCWTTTYYDVITLENAVLNCLDNFSDKDTPSSEQIIQWISLDNISEIIDYSAGENNSKTFGKRIDFIIFYNI